MDMFFLEEINYLVTVITYVETCLQPQKKT